MTSKLTRGLRIFLTISAVAVAIPAQAADCWSEKAASAAKVRDLETMLMVSALRCRLGGQDFLADYNGFVRASRTALTEVNDRLRGHFQQAVGQAGALNAYDRYVTSIANGYGAGVKGLDCGDMASILGAAAAGNGSLAELEQIAERAGANPALPGGVCPMVIAQRAP